MTDTVDLRNRLLLWHKVLCQITGSMALSYGGKGLSRATLRDWSERIRTVSDDLDSITGPENSRLDEAGRQVLRSAGSTAKLGEPSEREDDHEEDLTTKSELKGPDGPSPVLPKIERRASSYKKPLKKATRKS